MVLYSHVEMRWGRTVKVVSFDDYLLMTEEEVAGSDARLLTRREVIAARAAWRGRAN